jgi:DNA-directed RNA polymerase subunit M/transcription elongation factor TFIIS
MIAALRSSESGGSVSNHWSCELSSDRPADECPNCKHVAMQFYAQMPDKPKHENVFRCCACGSTWQF